MNIKNGKVIKILNTLRKFLQNKDNAIILTLIAFFSRGHLLIEDLPGIGKTTLALAIAKSLGLKFGRIQCTPDLLPSDILGITIYNKKKEVFEFKKGPIFNQVLLVDEINRATQKTQSAFLEAMEEEQVTIDGKTFNLEKPFFVIATQNPVEHFGTFPLPDSQMDRFIMNISIGYPNIDDEVNLLKSGSARENLNNISSEFTINEIFNIYEKIAKIYVSEKIMKFIVEIINSTRKNEYLLAGASPRGSLYLLNCSKTLAFFSNRDFVIPDDVKYLAPFVLSHRIIPKQELSLIQRRNLITDIVNTTTLPL